MSHRSDKITLVYAVFLAMLVSLPVLGVNDPWFQRVLLPGSSGSAVRAIIKDKRGFIWLGAEDELARFDGQDIVVYQTDPDNPRSISANYIWALAIDQDGVMWIATGSGLNRYNPDTDDFDRFVHDSDTINSLGDNNIYDIKVDHNNNLIIGTARGLSIFNPARTHFDNYHLYAGQNGHASRNSVREVFVDSNNRIWLGTIGKGLNLFDPQTKQFKAYMNNPGDPTSLIDDDVSAIEEDHQGRLWVGTYSRGLSRMNDDKKTFTHYFFDSTNASTLGSNNIADILEDSENNLWIATNHGGLAFYVPETESFRRLTHSAYDINSLSSNQPRHIYEDDQGNIWIGMFPNGAHFLDRSTAAFTNFFHMPDDPNSLSDNGILCFFEDSEGILWIGTENGLNAFDQETNTFKRYYSDPLNKHALRFGAVLTIEEDINGELWVGTWSGGVHRFDKKTQKFYNYYPNKNDPGSINSEFVWKVLRDRDDTLWFATETGGLNRYVRETDSFIHYTNNAKDPDSLIGTHVWTLMEDNRGDIWVATLDGLDRFDKKTEKFIHYRRNPNDETSIKSHQIVSLLEHSNGTIWVGTRDAGLNIYHPDSDSFSSLDMRDGLPFVRIASILEDNKGNVWINTVNGIAQINPDTHAIRTYNKSHGLVSNKFHRDASFKDKKGQLYVGSANGFSVFHPEKLVTEMDPPPVVITELRILNQPIAIGAKDGILSRSIVETDKLTLNYTHSMFSFTFAALSYRSPTSNSYAYMLEGFDQDWIEIGGQRTATYTNINPGNYLFRVKAANKDGVWNEKGAAIAIDVTPAPWQSRWAYIVYALCLMGVIYMTNKYKNLSIKSNIYRTLSITDPLTGIHNRASIVQAADDIFVRRRVQDSVGLLVMDIDHFKKVNDERGHDAGDYVLKEVAMLITRNIRSGDNFARWGGEEFVLLCSNISQEGLPRLAEKLRGVIAGHHFEYGGLPFTVTVSIGVAYAQPENTFDSLFKLADKALYEAKSAGRNRVQIAL